MASQDDTPQQKPTPGGSAETGRDQADQARTVPERSSQADSLSDASETIVSGDHAAGTGTAANGAATSEKAAAATAETADGGAAGSPAAPAADDGLDHDDWDAAFADAAGTPAGTPASAGEKTEEKTEEKAEEKTEFPAGEKAGDAKPRSGAADDAAVVPGGHPSLAQRSSLPMRRASTMPNLNGYGELSDEERKQASDIDAELPSGSHAAGSSAGQPSPAVPADTTPSDTAPSDTAASNGGTTPADAAPGTAPISTLTAGTAPVSTSTAGTPTAAAATAANATAAPASAAESSAPETAALDTAATDSVSDEPGDRADADEISEAEARRRAEERERAGAAKPILARILQVMIAVFFPVMLLAAAIRAVATPLFLWVEYHRPGFPSDSYGFSTDDRMTYGSYAVDYLLNFSGARYLGDLVTAGGEPLYLESEVSHMADVKTVLTIAFVSALAMAVLSVLACIYLAKRSPGGIRRALFSGAVLTLVLVGALIVTAVLGWENFFTQVHTLFFANGNWTFRMDDTLIRLFPAQFWMDAGIAIAALVLLTCIVVLICAWPTRARRERARSKQEAARRRYLDSLEAV